MKILGQLVVNRYLLYKISFFPPRVIFLARGYFQADSRNSHILLSLRNEGCLNPVFALQKNSLFPPRVTFFARCYFDACLPNSLILPPLRKMMDYSLSKPYLPSKNSLFPPRVTFLAVGEFHARSLIRSVFYLAKTGTTRSRMGTLHSKKSLFPPGVTRSPNSFICIIPKPGKVRQYAICS